MKAVEKVQALTAAANAKTGESDATLTDAVQTLIDGYGGSATLQSKSVVIHEGESKTVTPDAGYDGLSSVTAQYSDDWVKPEEWFDIESLPLDPDYSCFVYYLVDTTLPLKKISIGDMSNNAKVFFAPVLDDMTLDEWTEVIKSSNKYTFNLNPTHRYYVVKAYSGDGSKFQLAHNVAEGFTYCGNNDGSNQPIVWMYGKVTKSLSLYVNATAGICTIYMKRARLFLSETKIGYGFKRYVESVVINDGNVNGEILIDSVNSNINTKKVVLRNMKSDGVPFKVMANTVFVDLSYFDPGESVSFQQAFQLANMLEKVLFTGCNFGVTGFYYAFSGCQNLKFVDMSMLTYSGDGTWTSAFANCYDLEYLRLPAGSFGNINLSVCYKLSHQSLLDIIDDLIEVDGYTLTLGETNKGKLTEDEIAVATEKGWTIA